MDPLHFLISLPQVLAMNADDLFEAYLKKNAANSQRQNSAYRVKDESDSEHVSKAFRRPSTRVTL